MKMMKKKLMLMLAFLAASNLVSCGETEIHFKVSVTDESKEPLANVECIASMYCGKKEGGPGLAPYNVSALTNHEGIAILQGVTEYFNNTVVARKDGYYESRIDRMWITGRDGSRWQPWPVEVDLIMKKIQNPIPMYALRCGSTKLFVFPDKEYGPHGFDLMAMDWVAPNGIGEVADFILEGIRDDPEDKGSNPSGILRMTFSNPEDGILAVDKSTIGESLLRSPSLAPEGGYQKEWSFPNKINIKEHDDTTMLPEMVYVFRVRTKTDKEGNIIESHYGKIHGNIFAVLAENLPAFSITYYLNGTTNERNLEWDMENNLFENFPRSQWPRNP